MLLGTRGPLALLKAMLGLLEPASVKVTSSQSKNLSVDAPLSQLAVVFLSETLDAPSPAQVRPAGAPAPTARRMEPGVVVVSIESAGRVAGSAKLAGPPLRAPV